MSEDNLDEEELQELLDNLPLRRREQSQRNRQDKKEQAVLPPEPKRRTLPESVYEGRRYRLPSPSWGGSRNQQQHSRWEDLPADCPSLIITSKNACKAVSLIHNQNEEPRTLYSTYASNCPAPSTPAETSQKKRPVFPVGLVVKMQDGGMSEQFELRRPVQLGTRYASGDSRGYEVTEVRKQGSMGSINVNVFPSIVRMRNSEGPQAGIPPHTSRKGILNRMSIARTNLSFGTNGQMETLSASANVKVMMEQTPFINISIKNVHIDRPAISRAQLSVQLNNLGVLPQQPGQQSMREKSRAGPNVTRNGMQKSQPNSKTDRTHDPTGKEDQKLDRSKEGEVSSGQGRDGFRYRNGEQGKYRSHESARERGRLPFPSAPERREHSRDLQHQYGSRQPCRTRDLLWQGFIPSSVRETVATSQKTKEKNVSLGESREWEQSATGRRVIPTKKSKIPNSLLYRPYNS